MKGYDSYGKIENYSPRKSPEERLKDIDELSDVSEPNMDFYDTKFWDPKAETAGKRMLKNYEASLVQCRYCLRKFRRHALEKHIAINCRGVEYSNY